MISKSLSDISCMEHIPTYIQEESQVKSANVLEQDDGNSVDDDREEGVILALLRLYEGISNTQSHITHSCI